MHFRLRVPLPRRQFVPPGGAGEVSSETIKHRTFDQSVPPAPTGAAAGMGPASMPESGRCAACGRRHDFRCPESD